jgi:hypothetical protein
MQVYPFSLQFTKVHLAIFPRAGVKNVYRGIVSAGKISWHRLLIMARQ